MLESVFHKVVEESGQHLWRNNHDSLSGPKVDRKSNPLCLELFSIPFHPLELFPQILEVILNMPDQTARVFKDIVAYPGENLISFPQNNWRHRLLTQRFRVEQISGHKLEATQVAFLITPLIATLVCGPRDHFISWDRNQKLSNLTKVANNYRFALKVRGIGSRVLSLLESEAKKRWKERYGERLVLLESFVQPPYQGTSYKAANWTYLGMTKGFAVRRAPVSLWKRAGGERQKLWETNPRLAAKEYAKWNGGQLVKVSPTPKKLIFVRPLHRYWRRRLLRQPAQFTDSEVDQRRA